MNHKDSTYRTTLVYVVVAIASRAQTSDTSSVLGWGALALVAEHASSREVNETRRPLLAAGRVRSKKNTSKKKTKQKNAPPKTHH